MAEHVFRLPDLGEGLPDAEIVEWKIAEGDLVTLDQPIVAMETAKAVVEVPAPVSGRVSKLWGKVGDVIETGKPLVSFEVGVAAAAPAPAAPTLAAAVQAQAAASSEDSGTVVGAVEVSNQLKREQAVSVGGIKALPATRALARKLGVDLATVVATGPEDVVSADDVRAAAAAATQPPASAPSTARVVVPPAPTMGPRTSAPLPATPAPSVAARSDEPSAAADGWTALRGVRRNMARTMAQAHAEVVPTSLMDDADIHAWAPGQDITVRLIRAIARACDKEPALNSWLNAREGALRRHAEVHLGIAVDTAEGLFVPVIRNAGALSPERLRGEIDRIRIQTEKRSIPPEDLSGATITLSNFGKFAGRYATPVVVPPQVAIVAAGKLHWQAIPVIGGIEAHRIIPISLTFDHRACTGGEAARFLHALLADLARAV